MPNSSNKKLSESSIKFFSIKRLQKWAEIGELHKQELLVLLNEVQVKLRKGTSPTKIITLTEKNLKLFFANKEVKGDFELLNQRHIVFMLTFPEYNDESVIFPLILGEINARTKCYDINEYSAIKLSVHAVERLMERVGDGTESSTLIEIYSAIKYSIAWQSAAHEVGAKFWPLISNNGFFVGTSGNIDEPTTVITWMKDKLLSEKWRIPIYNLNQLKINNSKKLTDIEFIKEFIRSFPWMLHDHSPGLDIASNAWEKNEFEDLPEAKYELEIKKKSISYIPGLNYQKLEPPFKVGDEFDGIVVQKRTDGNLMVGLKNGWVGRIPKLSSIRGSSFIENYEIPNLGDEIKVCIHKINYWHEETAYAISLEPLDIINAEWLDIETKMPLKTKVNGTITFALKDKYYGIQLSNGYRGIISKPSLDTFIQLSGIPNAQPIGLNLNFEVSGYHQFKKNLILQIPGLIDTQKYASQNLFHREQIVEGICSKKTNDYSQIKLAEGCYGILHKHNFWNHELPNEGERIKLYIFNIDEEKFEINLAGLNPNSPNNNYFTLPLDEKRWDIFTNTYQIGDVLKVQVRTELPKLFGFNVCSQEGFLCFLPSSEVDWSESSKFYNPIRVGEFFNVEITKINLAKKRIQVSKRLLEPHPLDKVGIINKSEPHTAIVTSVVDYGYFLTLIDLKISGLLHISNVPTGWNMVVGDTCMAFIKNYDPSTKRTALSLS